MSAPPTVARQGESIESATELSGRRTGRPQLRAPVKFCRPDQIRGFATAKHEYDLAFHHQPSGKYLCRHRRRSPDRAKVLRAERN
jgi:hypothetical protein